VVVVAVVGFVILTAHLFIYLYVHTQPAAGDYSYSGMHDQGPLLPVPRQGGSMAVLLACVDAAKDCNDEYLTGVIHQEKMQHQQEPLNDEEQPIKRPKTT